MNQSQDMLTLLDSKHEFDPDQLHGHRMKKKGKGWMSNEELNEVSFRPGDRFKVTSSPRGSESGKTGVVIDWEEVRTDSRGATVNVKGASLITPPDRKNQVPVRFDRGDRIIRLMFKKYLIKESLSVHEVILKQRDRDSLEELIDKHGLADVIETIAEIAFEKEEHIEQGDDGPTSLSRSWGKDAKALDTISARMVN